MGRVHLRNPLSNELITIYLILAAASTIIMIVASALALLCDRALGAHPALSAIFSLILVILATIAGALSTFGKFSTHLSDLLTGCSVGVSGMIIATSAILLLLPGVSLR